MEYSNDKIMTRKEYLKSKKKRNFFVSKLKYVLLVIIVVLLGIYVFKQLNIYNNVTKLANKVVEESKLAQTMSMYYVSLPYTKEGSNVVMIYKAYDDSRTIIDGSEDFSKIQILDNKLYGINKEKLYLIDLTNQDKVQVCDRKIQDYVIQGSNIYLRTTEGVYKYESTTKKLSKIIDEKVEQLLVDKDNIYIIGEGKTSKSIIRYNLNGGNKKILSDKYIVSRMYLLENDLYFINSKDTKLYAMSKNGNSIKKITDNKIKKTKSVLKYKDNIYYINSSDNNTLYRINLKTGSDERVIKKNIESIQNDGGIIFFKVSNSIGIFKYNIETGKYAQITSARATEYICLK